MRKKAELEYSYVRIRVRTLIIISLLVTAALLVFLETSRDKGLYRTTAIERVGHVLNCLDNDILPDYLCVSQYASGTQDEYARDVKHMITQLRAGSYTVIETMSRLHYGLTKTGLVESNFGVGDYEANVFLAMFSQAVAETQFPLMKLRTRVVVQILPYMSTDTTIETELEGPVDAKGLVIEPPSNEIFLFSPTGDRLEAEISPLSNKPPDPDLGEVAI